MKKNMGNTDRIIRLLLAAVFAVLYFGGYATGPLGTGFIIAAAILLLTSLAGFCPLYSLVGMNTCKKA